GLTFFRFAERRSDVEAASDVAARPGLLANWRSPTVWVPAMLLLVFAGWVAGRARAPEAPAMEMQIHEFGQLPLAYDGRVQPFDTLARNVLTVLSGQGKLTVASENPSLFATAFNIKPKQPAIL